ncbi:hypothetical protein IJ103_04250 [Candidatus Saccharibacteria bacterium]|nr:hypothetical protein [Candidatus Saccharibacteria bacterium]MBQ9017414.1 hypothetical protein [Candidatus Saccharibacteria bacterium]
MNGSLIALIIAVIVVGILIFVAITLTQNRKHSFNREEYQAEWLTINNSLKKDSPDSYNMVIVKADKFLDRALIEMGVPGKTMGERLKRLHGRLSEEDDVWSAHKSRNRIAHETNYNATYYEAKRSLAAFKSALKDIGAI